MAEEAKNQEEKKEEALPKIPAGKKIVGARAFCEKHGDITRAVKYLEYVRVQKDPESGKLTAVHVPDMICKACLSDWIRKQVADGVFGKVHAVPEFGPDIEALAPFKFASIIDSLDEVKPLDAKGKYYVYNGEGGVTLPNGDKVEKGNWIVATGSDGEDSFLSFDPATGNAQASESQPE